MLLRSSLLALATFTLGCASDPGSTLSSKNIVGTWDGTTYNGKTYRYEFDAAGTFQWGAVEHGSFIAIASGTVSVDHKSLSLDATSHDEDGTPFYVRTTSDAYGNGSQLCDTAFYKEADSDDTLQSYTTHVTSQSLDASGAPLGQPVSQTKTIQLVSDGTAVMLEDDYSTTGTFTRQGDQVTLSMPGSSDGSVIVLSTYTIVDDLVMCDPVYVR